MKLMIGQKHYGKVMMTSYETLLKYQNDNYKYLIEYSNNDDVKKI